MFGFGASAAGGAGGTAAGGLALFPTAFAVGSVAMAAYQLHSAKQAKKQAKSAGKAAARLIKAETQEQLRRMKLENRQTLGLIDATAGASGVHMAGSTAAYRSSVQTEMMAQEQWTERAGKLRARAARKQGGYIGSAAMNAGISGALSTLGSAGMTGYHYGWWGNR